MPVHFLLCLLYTSSLTSFASDDVAEMVSGFAAVDADKNNLLVYVDTQSEKPFLYQITKNSKGAVVKNAVSYTNLDVYMRQAFLSPKNLIII